MSRPDGAGRLMAVALVVALFLTLLPLPSLLEPLRPYWMALVIIYWALEVQDDKPAPKYRYLSTTDATVEMTGSTSGLEENHLPRFLSALETCSYLDWCANIPYVRDNLDRLRVARDVEGRQEFHGLRLCWK